MSEESIDWGSIISSVIQVGGAVAVEKEKNRSDDTVANQQTPQPAKPTAPAIQAQQGGGFSLGNLGGIKSLMMIGIAGGVLIAGMKMIKG